MATKKTPVEKALSKKVSSAKRKAKNKAKKAHPGYYVIAFIFLVIGFAVSFYALSNICQSDCFEIKGTKETVLKVGDTLSYKDEGVNYISMGKDLSSNVEIQTNMVTDSNGNYTGSTDEIGEYYIIYKATDGRCNGMTRYRTFKVTE